MVANPEALDGIDSSELIYDHTLTVSELEWVQHPEYPKCGYLVWSSPIARYEVRTDDDYDPSRDFLASDNPHDN